MADFTNKTDSTHDRRVAKKLFVFTAALTGIFTLAAIWAAWVLFAPDRWVYREDFQGSELLIQEAESFRAFHGRVPSESELSGAMTKYGWQPSERCPCYEATDESNYLVWFVYRTLGSSMVYRSERKTWNEED